MILHILRALFVLIMAAVGYFGIQRGLNPITMTVMLVVAILIVGIDMAAPRKKLAVFSGTFLGLVVGLLLAYAFSFVVELVVDQSRLSATVRRSDVVHFINLVIGAISCYLAISFILQTKDDFRFIIPYVEFTRQTKGSRPVLLDTSVLIDGRISDIVTTGVIESQLVVPRFVLLELQSIADSADKLKRNRGRRGLDILQKLRENSRVDLIQYDSSGRELPDTPVDEKLLQLAKELDARILTTDFNLNKVAQLRGVDVININDLANAMKPVVLPGERMNVRLLKPGEQPDQGIGYLEDGTMVVVEQGRQHLNEEVEFTVTSALQTSAGRMIFGRMGDGSNGGQRRHRREGH